LKTTKETTEMSWSIITDIVHKRDAVAAILQAQPQHDVDPPTEAQIYDAKKAALELVRGVPGPFVSVSMSGHANGVGWQQKEGYANDAINISVTQHLVESYG
jgi:hypothetical protein